MLRELTLCLSLSLGGLLVGHASAATDPSTHQIYEAVEQGHLAEAQRMMEQVLRDHPDSAKAHYVAAEVYARAGKLPSAREQLNTAQSLEPGLPFVKAQSLNALEQQLSRGGTSRSPAAAPQSRTSLWFVFAVAAGGVLLWLATRRRSGPPEVGMSRDPGPAAVAPGVSSTSVPPSVTAPAVPGSAAPSATGGIASSLASGLAGGLAVGAGVVAGEALARHFVEGGEPREENTPVVANDAGQDSPNADSGGTDFGVTDDGSWNDDQGTSGDDSDWS